MIVGNESVVEHDFVEIVLAGHLIDRIDRDAGRLHVHQKLREAVAAVLFGGRRGAEQAEHVIGDMGVAGPDLRAVDAPAAVGLGRLGLGGEQVGTGARLAHADDEAQFAAADAGQDVLLDVLGRVFEQDRAALPVGDEVQAHRRVGDAEFFGDDVTLEKIALLAAVFFRPGHADPAFGADPLAERAIVVVAMAGPIRDEGAGGHFLGEKGAHFGAQFVARGRQADLVEAEIGAHGQILPRRQHGPELIGAAPRDQFAERRRPVAFVAEIVAPRQQAKRVAMQNMLVGEADRAMHLVRDGRSFRGGLAGADFRGSRFEQDRVVERGRLRDGVGGRTGGGQRGRGFAGEAREVLLHGLEFSDRPLEGHALIGISHAERQDRLQGAGGLHAAHARAHQHQRGCIEAGRRRRAADDFRALEGHAVGSVAGEILSFAHAAVGGLHQSNRLRPCRRWPRPRCVRNLWRREFRGSVRSRCRRRSTAMRSRGRAGATVIAPAGAEMPARASSHPAISVSASGTGTA